VPDFHPLDRIWTHRPWDPSSYADLAYSTALRSPCAKSKRGVVLRGLNTYAAYNGPPEPFSCGTSTGCSPSSCVKVAIHAEQRAIMKAGPFAKGSEMIHIKVKDEVGVVSGPPSCWQCSRMILEAGISGMWLLHDEGWVRYTAEEFHKQTLENCNIL
jgi:deoxycytidylate deaminase